MKEYIKEEKKNKRKNRTIRIANKLKFTNSDSSNGSLKIRRKIT